MPQLPADNPAPLQQSRTVLLATDNKNSILAEVAGGKPNSIAYSAYGQQSAQQDVETNLGFNGALREAHLGWYLLGNGYRAYNPILMRFHSPDSWSPFGKGGLNAYMYCVGDPVNFSDPTGHMPKNLFSFLKKSKAVSKAPSTSSVAQLVPPKTPVTTRARAHSEVSATASAPSDQTLRPLTVDEWMNRQSAEAVTPLRDSGTGEPIFGILPFESRLRTRSPQPPVPEGLMSYDEFSQQHYASGLQSNRSEIRPSNSTTLVHAKDGNVRISLNRPGAAADQGSNTSPATDPNNGLIRLRLNSPLEENRKVRK